MTVRLPRRALAVVGGALLGLSVLLGSATAFAHDINYYANGTYPGRPHQERVVFGRDATGEAFRTRMLRAQNQWDNITNAFQFIIYDDTVESSVPERCSAADQPGRFGESDTSLINYQYLDGRGRSNNAVAATATCESARTGRLEYFNMIVDTADDIYFGEGDAPDGATDLASIAVHELGHAAGFFYHYDDEEARDAFNESICRNNSDQQTMCRSIHPGTERMRTLQDHDRHTHADAYNR